MERKIALISKLSNGESCRYLNDTDNRYDIDDIKKRISNGDIKIDFRIPKNTDVRKEVKEHYKKGIIRNLSAYSSKYLPTHLYEYYHPINGEYAPFVLYEKDDGELAITLANLDSTHKYKEFEIPEKLIDGDYISTELDISSGKICFLGDNIRELFPEDDWKIDGYKTIDNFRDNEKDALKHIEYFSEKGYFFTADSFYPTLSKKDNEYHIFETVNMYDDDIVENGEIIEENLRIDSDHTLVIIDNDLLSEKLEKYKGKYDESWYFKYCLDVEPGRYKIDFNWKRKIDFVDENDEDSKGILTY